MALTVGELQVVIDAQVGPLRRDLDQLGRRFKTFDQQAGRGLNQVNRSAQGAGRSLRSLTGVVVGLGAAITAIGTGVLFTSLVRGSIQASAAFEGFEVRLRALLGSQKEANAALETFIEDAAKTPFAVEDIVGGATTLASVALGNRESLEELTRVSANLAAVTGLSFQDAAGNLQRSLAGGIASADLFRERGVRQLIESVRSIPDLTALPLAQQRQAFVDTFGELGEFGTAAEDLSFTLAGALSNIGDSFQNLRAAIGDAIGPGVIDAARNVIIPFLDQLQALVIENTDALETFARSGIGSLLKGFSALARGLIFIIRGFKQFQQGIREIAVTIERFKAFAGVSNDLALFERQIVADRQELARFENGLTQIENRFKEFGREAQRLADTPAGLGAGAPERPDRTFDVAPRVDPKQAKAAASALEKAQRAELQRTNELVALRDNLIQQDLARTDATAAEIFALQRQIEDVSRTVGQATSATAQQAGAEILATLQTQLEELRNQQVSLLSESTVEGLTTAFQNFVAGDFGGVGVAFQDLFAQQTETALVEGFQAAIGVFEDLFSSAISAAGQALPSLFGEGGALGGLLSPEFASGLLGLGGTLLQSALGGGADVQSSASAVRSAVTSTQAVRGVVAGPSQIGIARVGESIAEAFAEPTRLLALIERNTRLALVDDGGAGAAALADTSASLA
ncbi:MAG: hypothetical protein GY778_28870 [bacterium]|nr:hypothetical protein [bacterium]